MGEYARRKYDQQEVKIGTCESMYYLRYEQRRDVTPMPGSLNPATQTGLWFRLPFPDEDDILPGDFQNHDRGLQLPGFSLDNADPGLIQLRHECGLLLNVPCYHGEQLPDVYEQMKAFWNGKNPSFYQLAAIKTMTDDSLLPIVRCKYCHRAWRCFWDDVLPFTEYDSEIHNRLTNYQKATT